MLPNERTTRDGVAAVPGVVEGLIVAPDRECARPLVDFLRAEGVNVQVVNAVELGFEEALLHRPNVVIIDERISKAGGVDLCERLKANSRTHFLPVILFAHGKQSDLLRLDALAAGADALFAPATSKEERRARLWALLRSQAIFRKLDGKREAQGNAICNKRRWVRGLVHDIQNSLGAIQANFEYIAQLPDTRDKKSREEFEECVQDTRATFREMVANHLAKSSRNACRTLAPPSARWFATCARCSNSSASRRVTLRSRRARSCFPIFASRWLHALSEPHRHRAKRLWSRAHPIRCPFTPTRTISRRQSPTSPTSCCDRRRTRSASCSPHPRADHACCGARYKTPFPRPPQDIVFSPPPPVIKKRGGGEPRTG